MQFVTKKMVTVRLITRSLRRMIRFGAGMFISDSKNDQAETQSASTYFTSLAQNPCMRKLIVGQNLATWTGCGCMIVETGIIP